MIDQLTIDRIQNAAQIYDVVSDYVTLRKRGINYVGLCPFHEDKTPSFYVSPAKNICKCFACGEGGTPIHFVMKHEQLSYSDALKFLAKKYGIEVKERELTDEQKQQQSDRESMFILNSFAQKTFTANLFEHAEGKSVGLSYFRERGFRQDIIEKFQLGYSLEERDAFARQALNAGYQQSFLEKVGLAITGDNNYLADRFRGRVMFPVHSLSGKVVAFGGRILKKDVKMAKYVNSPESEIYHKSNELYGIYFARQAMVKHDHCFLVEGYTDVISMHQAGIENVVASSGTALTHGQIRLIRRFTPNITVLYDGDAAGIKAALRGIDLLLEEGMNVKVVLLPDGEDPDSFARKQNASSFIDYIKTHQTDFIQFKARLLLQEAGGDPIKKAGLITDVVSSIAIIPEEIIRSVYIKECSHILEVDEKVLLNEVTKRRKANLEEKKPVVRTPDPTAPDTGMPVPGVETTGVSAPTMGDPGQAPATVPKSYPFDAYELSLLRYVVRYGERILYSEEEEETHEIHSVKVVEHIAGDLQVDDMSFQNPLYRRMLEEALEHASDETFVAERFFLAHHDPVISKLAVELVSDKYPLSKYHSKFQQLEDETDRLIEIVPYDLMLLKEAFLRKQITDITLELKEMKGVDDFERLKALMEQLADLKRTQALFAKHLGERIVLKM